MKVETGKRYLLTLNEPIATKVVCFFFSSSDMFKKPLWQTVWTQIRLLLRSSLFWVQAVCFYTLFVTNVRQLFAADDFSRRHFQMHFFLGDLRVNSLSPCVIYWLYKRVYLFHTKVSLLSVRLCVRFLVIVSPPKRLAVATYVAA